MKEVTTTTKVYKFDELSDDAKETAITEWRTRNTEYFWGDEWMDSLKAFTSALGIKLVDWSIGPYSYSFIKWEYTPHNDEVMELSGLRLRTWIINNWMRHFSAGKYYSTAGHYDETKKYHYKSRHSNIFIDYESCPLTGYAGDMALINPILDFLRHPSEGMELSTVIESCMDQFIKEYNADMEYQDSDEYITEMIQANEYDFCEDGNIF